MSGPSTVIPVLDVDEPDLGLDLDGDDLDVVPSPCDDSNMADDFSLPLEGDESSGPKVQDKLASYVETCVTKRIEKEHLKSLKRQARRPENCPSVVVPQVNPGIWRDLDRHQKSRDVHMQSTQELVVRGLHLATDLRQSLLASPSVTSQDMQDKCTTLIALLGNASLELSFRRRELLRPSLNTKYHSLCAPSTPVGKHLFGDAMSEELKSINEMSKVSKGVMNTHQTPKNTLPDRSGSGKNYRNSGRPSRSLNWNGRPTPFRGRNQQFRQTAQRSSSSQEQSRKSA